MMTQNNERKIPPKKIKIDEKRWRGTDDVFNFVVKFLIKTEAPGWSKSAKEEEDMFFKAISGTLWYIDGHHEKFANNEGVRFIPLIFRLKSYNLTFHTLLDASGHAKRQLPSLTSEKLIEHGASLEKLLEQRWFKAKANWKTTYDHVTDLKRSIDSYDLYLEAKVAANTAIHEREEMTDPRPSVEVIEPPTKKKKKSNTIFDTKYKCLSETLASTDLYVPVNVLMFAPLGKSQRYRYIGGIIAAKLEIAAHLVRISNPHHRTYIWRIPDKKDERSNDRMLAAYAIVMGVLEKKHSRQMRQRHIVQCHSLLATGVTRAQIVTLLRQITEDKSAEQGRCREDVAKIHDRLLRGYDLEKVLLLTETERESRECKFELFWDALNAVLNREGGYIHADSRRHGVDHLERPAAIQNGETTVGHNSIRHLIEVTTKYAEEQNAGKKIEIPCREYVRIQFLPCRGIQML